MRLLRKFILLLYGFIKLFCKKIVNQLLSLVKNRIYKILKQLSQPKNTKIINYIPIKKQSKLSFTIDYLISNNLVSIDKKHLIRSFLLESHLEFMDIGLLALIIKNDPRFCQETNEDQSTKFWQSKIINGNHHNIPYRNNHFLLH